MRILYICHAYPPNNTGVGSFVQTAGRALVKRGHEVYVIEPYAPAHLESADYREDEGIRIFQWGNGFWWYRLMRSESRAARLLRAFMEKTKISFFLFLWISYRCSRYISGFVKDYGIELVEVPDGNEAGLLTATPLNAPLLVRIHGSVTLNERMNVYNFGKLESFVFKKLERNLLHRASGIAAVSRFTAELAKDAFGLEKEIRVIYNAVEVSAVTARDFGAPFVLFVGRISEDKGIDTLAKAWNTIAPAYPGLKLVILGRGMEQIVWDIVEPAYHASVLMKGQLSKQEVLEHIAAARCFVLPSRYESFSMAILEAMAMGSPVIYTLRCSGTEVIDHGVNGLLVDPDDPGMLAAYIDRLLSDEGYRTMLGANAIEKAAQFADIPGWIIQNEMFYQLTGKTKGDE